MSRLAAAALAATLDALNGVHSSWDALYFQRFPEEWMVCPRRNLLVGVFHVRANVVVDLQDVKLIVVGEDLQICWYVSLVESEILIAPGADGIVAVWARLECWSAESPAAKI